jgi:EPS-associated MarR family transcriptional regulator
VGDLMTIPPPISEASKLELLRLLRSRPGLTQREAASALGVSVGKVNYCLRSLIEKGLVKAENYKNSNNKLAYFYLLTPSGISEKAELTRRFLLRKMREYEELRREIERLRRESENEL